jgi:hypothetical protein
MGQNWNGQIVDVVGDAVASAVKDGAGAGGLSQVLGASGRRPEGERGRGAGGSDQRLKVRRQAVVRMDFQKTLRIGKGLSRDSLCFKQHQQGSSYRLIVIDDKNLRIN